MKRSTLSILAALSLFALAGALPAAERRPNVIFILTDDLGYGDVGAFFQNLRRTRNDPAAPWHMTPHLDRLASEGIQLRDSYCAAPVCAPSRSSLLTGVTQGHARVRDNQFDWELARNYTVGSVMQGAGYATAAFGKWGLQGLPGQKVNSARDWPSHPLQRGFDFYFGYMRHGDGHWHYPFEDGREVYENYENVAAGLKLCYTTDLFTARCKKWIVDHMQAHPDQPFFIYLAYDTPHAKLQNPPCPYPDGGGLAGGVQWLGTPGHMINTATGAVDSYEHSDYAAATWDDDHNPATRERPWPDVDKRYATDVRRIDDAVGDLMRLLTDLGIDRNTVVVFTSDNGPSIESYLQGKDSNGFSYAYRPDFFDSFGPFDGIKRDCWEGGVRMPTMARWPGRIPAGAISTTPCGAWDWLATLADLGGQPAPARADGVSLVPTLTGQGRQRPSPVYVEYFQNGKTPTFQRFLPAHRGRKRGQMQIVRLGDYLGVRYDIKSAADDFEIYNVVTDPQEEHNLAGQPEFVQLQQEMKDRALRQRMPNSSAKRPYDTTPVPALETAQGEAGVRWQTFAGDWPWLPKFETLTPAATGVAPRPELSAVSLGDTNGVLFLGFLKVPETGEYTFYVTSDGPGFLRIHDCQVVDGDFGHAAGATAEGGILLAQGLHPFRLYYACQGSAASPRLQFEWSGPRMARQAVPAAAFSHGPQETAQP
jgi:arylsulfatase A-like enzyme